MAIIRKQGYRNRSTALDGNLKKTPTYLYDNTQKIGYSRPQERSYITEKE
ncbi:hypothetical protein V466_14090 [Pseudomonas mandelii PD30]|uniref:Uncharacterized protein n=1 Tax=Pseudomonas mandelii PD30 TaxID=1419583 RepID=A0A059L2X5_9PSED|nr:hypothetical protein V466_14090 [Pseudomonas mandelii PD30]